MWPVSWASTPMIWFGVCDFDQRAGVDEDAAAVDHEGVVGAVVDQHDADVLLGRGPPPRRIGAVYSRSSCSISASRITGRPPPRACARGQAFA